jgi:hypothetical protein
MATPEVLLGSHHMCHTYTCECEGVVWGTPYVASIMLVTLTVDGRCALPVISFPRVTGPHNVNPLRPETAQPPETPPD